MYTEHLTQALAVGGAPIHAQQLTSTTTLTTGKVDLSLAHRCLFVLDLGVFGGTSPTCSGLYADRPGIARRQHLDYDAARSAR